jgi:hypothetical protein
MQLAVRNVNEALYRGVMIMQKGAFSYPSRNGNMYEYPEPVLTKYTNPQERVLFCKLRDANPFFHFFESLWMLAGRNDLAFVKQFVKRMATYSDDGETLNGSAYGKRWRHWWVDTSDEPRDQLEIAIELLRNNPMDRRVVLQMWDPTTDLASDSKDVPCNTAVYFKLRDRVLEMTVSNRSNDVIWGAYGANAVHFSVLQEYVAGRLGVEIGDYYQLSNSYHIYADNPFWEMTKDDHYALIDPYDMRMVHPFPMFQDPEDKDNFDWDLKVFFEDPLSNGFRTKFFNHVVKPLWCTHQAYKKKDFAAAYEVLQQCKAEDWSKAALEWLLRKQNLTD